MFDFVCSLYEDKEEHERKVEWFKIIDSAIIEAHRKGETSCTINTYFKSKYLDDILESYRTSGFRITVEKDSILIEWDQINSDSYYITRAIKNYDMIPYIVGGVLIIAILIFIHIAF